MSAWSRTLLRQLSADPDAATDLQRPVTRVVAQVVPTERASLTS